MQLQILQVIMNTLMYSNGIKLHEHIQRELHKNLIQSYT